MLDAEEMQQQIEDGDYDETGTTGERGKGGTHKKQKPLSEKEKARQVAAFWSEDVEPCFDFAPASLVEQVLQPRDEHDFYESYHGAASSGSTLCGPRRAHQCDPHFSMGHLGEHWREVDAREALQAAAKEAEEQQAKSKSQDGSGMPHLEDAAGNADTKNGGGLSAGTATASATTSGTNKKKSKSSSSSVASGASASAAATTGGAGSTTATTTAGGTSKKHSSSASSSASLSATAGGINAAKPSLTASLAAMGIESASVRRSLLETDKLLGGDKTFHLPNAQSLAQRLLSMLVEVPPGAPKGRGPWTPRTNTESAQQQQEQQQAETTATTTTQTAAGTTTGDIASKPSGSSSSSSAKKSSSTGGGSGSGGLSSSSVSLSLSKRIEMEFQALGLLDGGASHAHGGSSSSHGSEFNYNRELLDRQDDELCAALRQQQQELSQVLRTLNGTKQRLYPVLSKITDHGSKLAALLRAEADLQAVYQTRVLHGAGGASGGKKSLSVLHPNLTPGAPPSEVLERALESWSATEASTGTRRAITGFIPDPVDLGGIPRGQLHLYPPFRGYLDVFIRGEHAEEVTTEHDGSVQRGPPWKHWVHPQHPHNPDYQPPPQPPPPPTQVTAPAQPAPSSSSSSSSQALQAERFSGNGGVSMNRNATSSQYSTPPSSFRPSPTHPQSHSQSTSRSGGSAKSASRHGNHPSSQQHVQQPAAAAAPSQAYGYAAAPSRSQMLQQQMNHSSSTSSQTMQQQQQYHTHRGSSSGSAFSHSLQQQPQQPPQGQSSRAPLMMASYGSSASHQLPLTSPSMHLRMNGSGATSGGGGGSGSLIGSLGPARGGGGGVGLVDPLSTLSPPSSPSSRSAMGVGRLPAFAAVMKDDDPFGMGLGMDSFGML